MTTKTDPGSAKPQIENLIRGSTVANWRLSALLVSYQRHLRAMNKRPATIDHYIGASRDYYLFADANGLPDPTKAKREHVEMWLEHLFAHYAQHTARNRFVGLRMFVRWLIEEGEITKDPTARIPMPVVDEVDKDVATRDQVRKVIGDLEKARAWRDAALVGLVYDTGMRAGELAAATIEDADLEHGLLRIPGGNTKGRRPRVVALSPQCVRMLDRYLRKRSDGLPQLFVGKRGAMTRSGIYNSIRTAFEVAGVTATIGPHDMRHTSASHVAREMSTADMMALYGWRTEEMARHYTRSVQQQNAIDAHRKASPLGNL